MNKLLYKIELCLVKVIPMIYALLSLLNTTLSYFGIDVVILSYIGSVSFITLLLLYVTSYVFKSCEYHRMFIHYTTVTWILNIIDLYIGIPVSDVGYFLPKEEMEHLLWLSILRGEVALSMKLST